MRMPIGKYKGKLIDNIITDIPHVRWFLKKHWFKHKYPHEYEYMNCLYESIIEQVENTTTFYCLLFSNNQGIKIGKTKQFIPKRMYDYVCTTNNYTKYLQNNPINIKKSVVFRTNDLSIEKHIKTNFKCFNKGLPELLDIDLEYIENEILIRSKKNISFFYSKKLLYDFIPYNNLSDLRNSFVIHTNKHIDFKNEYENHLLSKGLFNIYNPSFLNETMN